MAYHTSTFDVVKKMTRGFGAKMGQIFGKNFGFFSLLLSSLFFKERKENDYPMLLFGQGKLV